MRAAGVLARCRRCKAPLVLDAKALARFKRYGASQNARCPGCGNLQRALRADSTQRQTLGQHLRALRKGSVTSAGSAVTADPAEEGA